jgi:hypothetical protein
MQAQEGASANEDKEEEHSIVQVQSRLIQRKDPALSANGNYSAIYSDLLEELVGVKSV